MSAYALSRGSRLALGILTRHAGTEALLLVEPARELCAEITVEPIGTAAQGGQLEAVLHLREQRHSITLQRDDSANPQHLAEWVESIANGTLDTAQAAPQRAEPAVLLHCSKCGGAAVGYDYAIPGHEFRHGVKCPRSCMETEGYESSTQAHESWNAWQLEKLGSQPTEALDMVNHPPHYNSHPSGVECIEVTEHLPFCLGNAFKYLFRRDAKGSPLENIEKAIWYVNRHNETYPAKPELPEDAREALGMIVVHEPHPFSTAMLLIAGPSQCGGYDACMTMLEQEAARLRSGAEPLRAA